MVTDRLQKLIIEGKAIYKTFTVGGAEKSIINVTPDRFVIITNLIYMGSSCCKILGNTVELSLLETHGNTQLKIFSTKSYNQFMFRDFVDISETAAGDYMVTPKGITNIDTFLIHESDISFTFSKCGPSQNVTTARTPAQGIAYQTPFDYGKVGQPGAILTRQVSSSVLGVTAKESVEGGTNFVTSGQQQEGQFNFPVDANTQYTFLNHVANYPILNVQYLEIPGIPANLSGSY